MVSRGHFTPCFFPVRLVTQPLTSSRSLKAFLHLVSLGNNYSQWAQCPPPAPIWLRGFLTNTQKHWVERKKMSPWRWPGLQPPLAMVPVTGCFSGVWGWFALSCHHGTHVNFDLSLFLIPLKLLLSQVWLFGVTLPSWSESQRFRLLGHGLASIRLFSRGI